MQLSLSKALAVAAVSAASAMPASALTLASVVCSAGALSPTYIDCAGAFVGNNLGNAAKLAEVQAQMVTSFGSGFALVGSSGDAGSGPFISNSGGSSGTLTFDAPVAGSFVLALKAANAFSLYRFDGGDTGIASIDFNTLGVSVNKQGIAQGLSHATLYGGVPAVPEPETYAMMLAGLGVVGLMARRRRTRN